MITWAALLVLQGVEGGVGEPDGEQFLSDVLCCLLLSFILCYRFYSLSLAVIYLMLSFLFGVSSYHLSHFIFSIRCLFLSYIPFYLFYSLSLAVIYLMLSFLFVVSSYHISHFIFSIRCPFLPFILCNLFSSCVILCSLHHS
jgi:hypothetical protein